MLFDFPASGEEYCTILQRIEVLNKLMEQGGTDIAVPTPVSFEVHKETWAVGVAV